MHTIRYIMMIVGIVLPAASVFLALKIGVNSVQSLHTAVTMPFQSIAQFLNSAGH